MTGLVFTLFFFSGLCGLVYEVAWTRMLTLVMGNTVFASGTVLAAFMGGLALGSFLFGKIADRVSRPLLLYGVLELLLGAYCLALPLLFDHVVPLYRLLYAPFASSPQLITLAQFVFSGLLILLPSVLMGGTLPVLSKFLVEKPDRLASSVGRLFAVNSFGAVVGAVSAGFVLIPLIGISTSVHGAAFVNLAIGGIAFFLQQKVVSSRSSQAGLVLSPQEEGDGKMGRWVLIAYAASGCAALIYEVAWTRVLSLLLGSSVQAFSLMLAAFITGLALGSLLLSRMADRRSDLTRIFAILQCGVALSAIAFVPVIDFLPSLIRGLLRSIQGSFASIQAMNAALIFLVMLIPTTCLGAIFPIAAKLYSRSLPSLGSQLGRLYAGNTLGAVAGSLMAAFLLIPLVGLQKTILVASLISGTVGGLMLLASNLGGHPVRRAFAFVPLLLLAIVWALPTWDAKALSSGPYQYLYADEETARKMLADEEILFYKEGSTGTVAVKQRGDERFLVISGKVDASSGRDMPTQVLSGHLPLLLAKDPKDVLIVGLASGVTAGAVARHPVKRIDAVEVSREVIEAAPLFSDLNHDVMNDDRLNVIVQDGRNHLLLTDRLYDVIISEPSNPWMAGLASLYTKEFFELARQRLRPDGVMVQWISAYYTPNWILKSVIRTYAEVFPHLGLWVTTPGDILLVASQNPVVIDIEEIKKGFADERIGADLAKIRVKDWRSLVGRAVAEGPVLKEAVQDALIHADDRPFLEFELPKSLHTDTWTENAAWIAAMMGRGSAPSPSRGTITVSEGDTKALAEAQAAMRNVLTPPDEVNRGGETGLKVSKAETIKN